MDCVSNQWMVSSYKCTQLENLEWSEDWWRNLLSEKASGTEVMWGEIKTPKLLFVVLDLWIFTIRERSLVPSILKVESAKEGLL